MRARLRRSDAEWKRKRDCPHARRSVVKASFMAGGSREVEVDGARE